jgi:hypothetical protein
MRGTVVFVLTQNDKSLSVKGMKRVGNCYFVSQNPGTMNCLPMQAENAQQPSTA